MVRLIDVMDTVTKISKRVQPMLQIGASARELYDTILGCLASAPTVEAAAVVYCEQCKNWDEETGWCDVHSHFVDSAGGFCHPYESADWKMFDADYFCKDGERKENDRSTGH